MSYNISQHSITTTPTEISTGGTTGSSNSGGLVVKNFGEEIAWLGSSYPNATPADGFPVGPGETLSVEFPGNSALTVYAATEVGTTTVAVIQP